MYRTALGPSLALVAVLIGCDGTPAGNSNVQSILGTSGTVEDAGEVAFASENYDVLEGDGVVTLTVERTGGTDGEVTVDYETVEGTALAGQDFEAETGTLRFGDGVASRSFDIVIINNTIDQADRTFTVELSNRTGGVAFGSPTTATVEIVDDDASLRYDFEPDLLAIGPIDGRDNWFVGEATSFITPEVQQDDTSVNGTQVVWLASSNEGSSGEARMTRVNQFPFVFDPLTGTTATIQLDATAHRTAIFALGQESDTDGDVVLRPEDNEIGLAFGFFEGQFAVFAANDLTQPEEVADLGADDAATNWYQLRLRVDFTDEGTGSLEYRNLTRGQSEFTAVGGLQEVNLRLIENAAPDPISWNAMFLLLGTEATEVPRADNLIPNLPLTTP